MKIGGILDKLKKGRKNIKDLRPPNEPGIYAVFATRRTDLGDFPAPAGEVLYIGSTGDLHGRELSNHCCSKGTGFSTLRRSLGAILKTRLRLTARHRGTGKSKADFYNYRFQDVGEKRLTEWMSDNLKIGVLPLAAEELDELEKELIHQEIPVLNLKGNEGSPYKERIEKLRKKCSDEARRKFSP
ncbi:MAG: GIY-YIG nuclease family protein [Planctomycetota bacterium]